MQGVAVCAALVIGLTVALEPAPAGQDGTGTAKPPGKDQLAAVGKADAARPGAGEEEGGTPPLFVPPDGAVERVINAKRRDTFMKILRKAGAARPDAAEAIAAMRKVYDPRGLMPGQRVTVTLGPDADRRAGRGLLGFAFDADAERTIRVRRDAENAFAAVEIRRDLERRFARKSGAIKTSLYRAGRAAGLPPAVLVDLIRLFSWDVDFQRDVQPGDGFDVLVERFFHRDGRPVRFGDIVYAELTLSGEAHRLYRFKPARGPAAYFDDDGQSARKALLRTPVDGARLSSRFGRRRDPILGYTRMHRGIDFAAPRGTPVYAAGNGTVVRVGRNGAYGRYVRIRHNARYATAYAHLQRFRRGLRRGRRVRQGEIIGYVGSSGRSTGPHLHYEVLARNRQVNPFKLRLPAGRKLTGAELSAFRAARAQIVTRLGRPSPAVSLTRR